MPVVPATPEVEIGKRVPVPRCPGKSMRLIQKPDESQRAGMRLKWKSACLAGARPRVQTPQEQNHPKLLDDVLPLLSDGFFPGLHLPGALWFILSTSVLGILNDLQNVLV
jgi:hypothetical protein